VTPAGVAWIALWTLVGSGVVLMLVAPFLALGPLRVVLARTETLQRAQLVLDLERLQGYNDELARIPARMEPLVARMLRVRRSIEVSARMLCLPQATAAVRAAAIAVRALAKSLGA